MVCHTHSLVDETLEEILGGNAISKYLREQLYSLDCDDFTRVSRALEQAHGSGRFTAVDRGRFNGALEGYGHLHYLNKDWLATNFSHVAGRSIKESADQQIEAAAQQISDKSVRPEDAIRELDTLKSRFKKRMASKATGDWLIYRECPEGKRLYLAIHSHVTRDSEDELRLLFLLRQIEACCDEDVRLQV